jgi:hemerythrin-like domain-containing protein
METVSPPSLQATVRIYHQYMQELLHLHQEALLERDIGLALGFWQLHAQMLRLHIHLENEMLLPALDNQVDSPAWPASLYRAEHAKISSMGEQLGEVLTGLAETGLARRVVIALLDKQRSYKNLLEHHEEREEKGLLPELDAVLDAQQLGNINAVCAQSWQVLYQQQADIVTSLAARLDAYQ